jgi:uncharacterized protein (DUF1800 family)
MHKMRRATLLLAGLAAIAAAQSPRLEPTQPTSSAPSELLPDEQVQQVLNRLTFGARAEDAAAVRAMGIDKWIERQLHPDRISDPTTDALLARYPMLAMAPTDIIRNYNFVQQLRREARRLAADSTASPEARRDALRQDPQLAELVRNTRQFVGQVQSSQLARAVTTERQLNEVMVEFWENHFSVYFGKGQTQLFLTQLDRDVIRPNALGKFRDLLGGVAHSPAMLFYLDNFQSVADSAHPTLAQTRRRPVAPRPRLGLARIGARRPGSIGLGGLTPAQQRRIADATPEQRAKIAQALQARAKRGVNENYARELMELHTLGVDGGYTQKDVQEVARALTGWSFNRQTGAFVFNPNAHDAGEKIILGQKFPAGHGEDEGERVLDLLARAPATARFITTKLARHFVSDDPPAALVDRCASRFTKTDGDIRETLKCVITSPEFFSRAAYRAKVKTPFELVASALRAVNAQPDTTPRTAQIVARLGQPIFGRQTPDGWPDKGDAWMNTGAILNRINFGLSVAAGQVPGARLANMPDFATLRAQPRAQQVDAVVKSMLGGQVSSVTREVLMSGTNPMLARGAAATDATADDSTPTMQRAAAKGQGALGLGRGQLPAPKRPINLQGLPQVVGLALGAPEFQRR